MLVANLGAETGNAAGERCGGCWQLNCVVPPLAPHTHTQCREVGVPAPSVAACGEWVFKEVTRLNEVIRVGPIGLVSLREGETRDLSLTHTCTEKKPWEDTERRQRLQTRKRGLTRNHPDGP